jgi:hypothetical protein
MLAHTLCGEGERSSGAPDRFTPATDNRPAGLDRRATSRRSFGSLLPDDHETSPSKRVRFVLAADRPTEGMNMVQSPAVAAVALVILALSGTVAVSADAPGGTARPGRLAPDDYRVTAIEAWGGGGASMLGVKGWERVEVRGDGERRKLVIHYQGGRTRAFDLRSGGPSAPGTWHTDRFAVSVIASPDGSIRLRMHFCYRGFVHLAPRGKGDSSSAP